MTEKENLLRCYRHQEPAWVPRYALMPPDPNSPYKQPFAGVCPEFMMGHMKSGGKDVWGVEYVGADSVGGATLPVPGKFAFEDVTEWRDHVKAPDISGFDWEAICKKGLDRIDRENTAVVMSISSMFFHALVGFMGFENTFYALMEEPEECKALLDYVCTFYESVIDKTIDIYKPDCFQLVEDIASAKAPFVSPEMYREIFKPFYVRFLKKARERDIIIVHHNCGYIEPLLDDWMDLGIQVWDPAQPMNDVLKIKKEYGDRLVIAGGWDSTGPVAQDDATEEFVRAEVRKTIDMYAPGGGYCFTGFVLLKGDEGSARRRAWIDDEYNKYGRTWYQTHG